MEGISGNVPHPFSSLKLVSKKSGLRPWSVGLKGNLAPAVENAFGEKKARKLGFISFFIVWLSMNIVYIDK